MKSQFGRELRQLDLMAARLEAYRHDRLSLGPLINDLDALWNELTMAQGAWREELRGHWWTLEQVYAVALDRGYASLPDITEYSSTRLSMRLGSWSMTHVHGFALRSAATTRRPPTRSDLTSSV